MYRLESIHPKYVSSSVVRSLYTHLEEQLGTQYPALLNLKYKDYELSDSNFRYSEANYLALMAFAAEHLNDTCFGFHFGQLAHTNRWGVMGYLLTVSEDIKQLLHVKGKYQSLVDNMGTTLLHRSGDNYVAEWYTDDEPCRHVAEETITSWVCFGRHLTKNAIKPVKVSFRHSAPEEVSAYERFFDCEVKFGQSINAVTFPKSVMQVSIKQSDRHMFEALDLHAERLLADAGADDMRQQMRAYVIRELPNSVPTIDTVAKRFNLSVRSLQRRFEDWETNFKEFMDTTRSEVAIAYLRNGGDSLMELTFLLGFSEQSAFQRAFKRWTGMTPKKYQEQNIYHDKRTNDKASAA